MMTQLRFCRRRPVNSPPRRAPRGMTAVEVLIVAVLMGILFAMAAPTFVDTVEQAHADIAGADLQMIWSAERYYWLENRTYTTNLSALEALGLLDPTKMSGHFKDLLTSAKNQTNNSKFTVTSTGESSGRPYKTA